MVEKYIIDKADIHNLLTGKEIPLENRSKARAFCVEIEGGVTNGEMFQAIFPCDGICFDLDWWNAPYKAEREAEE